MTKKTYVMQDGADFYIFTGPPSSPARSVERIITFDGRCDDFDLAAARIARSWFINEAAPALGLPELAWE
jgi:hypothetical protein